MYRLWWKLLYNLYYMMILDEMDDYDVYDDVVVNLYDELYDDIYIYNS